MCSESVISMEQLKLNLLLGDGCSLAFWCRRATLLSRLRASPACRLPATCQRSDLNRISCKAPRAVGASLPYIPFRSACCLQLPRLASSFNVSQPRAGVFLQIAALMEHRSKKLARSQGACRDYLSDQNHPKYTSWSYQARMRTCLGEFQ